MGCTVVCPILPAIIERAFYARAFSERAFAERLCSCAWGASCGPHLRHVPGPEDAWRKVQNLDLPRTRLHLLRLRHVV